MNSNHISLYQLTTNNLKFEHHVFSPQTKKHEHKKNIHKTVSMENPQKNYTQGRQHEAMPEVHASE